MIVEDWVLIFLVGFVVGWLCCAAVGSWRR